MAAKRFFVTGTDTEVGKTVASCALLQTAKLAGYCAVGYKPVASGSDLTTAGLRNQDALALQRRSAINVPYAQINPLCFAEATAPHIVSEELNQPISFSALSEGLHQLERQFDWIVIEGAGGWYTPLSSSHTFADWVVKEQLPVILVVGIRLGCINHAMLTADAIGAGGLKLAGWIANDVVKPGTRHREYLQALQLRLSAPLLGELPHLPDPDRCDLSSFLKLP